MIRDGIEENKTAKKSIRDGVSTDKKVTSRANRKKIAMGERKYYASETNKLKDINKAVSFTNKFTLIIFSILYALILFVFIVTYGTEEAYSTVRFIVYSSVYGAFIIWFILWYTVIKPHNEVKAQSYTKELERLSRESLDKIGNAYKVYGDEYIEKIKRENQIKAEAVKSLQNKEESGEKITENN